MAGVLRRGAQLASRRLPCLAEVVGTCNPSSTAAPGAAALVQQALPAAAIGVGAACSRHLHASSSSLAPVHIEDEPYCRQRQVVILGNRVPTMAPDTWLADSAVLIGDVDLFERVRRCAAVTGRGIAANCSARAR